MITSLLTCDFARVPAVTNARKALRTPLFLCAFLALAIAVGLVSIQWPLPFTGMLMVYLGGTALVAIIGVERCLPFCLALIVVGETKFRARNAGALLEGNIDWEVGFELACYGLVALVTLGALAKFKWQDLKPRGVELPLAAYTLLAVLSTLWSVDFRLSAVRSLQQAILFSYVFVLARVERPARVLDVLRQTLTAYVLIGAALALLIPAASYKPVLHTTALRFSWFAVHPIVAAEETSMALILFAVGALFVPESETVPGKKGWRYLAIAGLIGVIIATRARGPLVALAGALSVLFGLRYLGRSVGMWFGALCLVVFLVCTLCDFSIAAAVQTLLESQSSLRQYVLRGESAGYVMGLAGRIGLWKTIYRFVIKRPIFGYGFVASRTLLLQWFKWAGESHNALAESLLNLGIVGTVLLWGPMLYVVGGFFMPRVELRMRERWEEIAVIASLVFLLIISVDSASFAGFITYDPMVFAVAMMLHQRLRMEQIRSSAANLVPGNNRVIRASRMKVNPRVAAARGAVR
jgi:O-antigen ligase